MAYVIATCHTDGCLNNARPIEFPYEPEFGVPAMYCGPCGQPIEDVTDHPYSDPA